MTNRRERNATPGKEELPSPDNPNVQRSIEFYQGPYPPPDLVRAYYEIDPKIAQTTFDLATKAQEHSRKMNELVVASDIKKSERGQILAGLLAFALIGAAFTGFLLDLPRGGVVVFGASAFLPFLSFASRFIRQMIARSHREDK